MISVVSTNKNERVRQDFLTFPATLYTPTSLSQDIATEKALLAGAHPLSHCFSFCAFTVYDDGMPVARFALTVYPDNTLYLGYFECVNRNDVADSLFAFCDRFARKNHILRIIGPVNASFWIGYRLKIDQFDNRPYFGEPYNQPYYLSLLTRHGYVVSDRYLSTLYGRSLSAKDRDDFMRRSTLFKHQQYDIVGITPENFDHCMKDVHAMLMTLYSDFPAFHTITFADFSVLFGPMRSIIVPEFAKVAYYKGKPAGFMIGFPDYETLHLQEKPWTKLRIVLKKIRSRRYVMLYLGVLPEHHGLARAMIAPTIWQLYLRLSPMIGALIHAGKPTADYAKTAITHTRQYVLLEKHL